jgi:hydroxyethylthiazole kinase
MGTSLSEDIKRLRDKVPLIHCLTNIVVTNFSANVLLAVGASPAMVVAAEEAGSFAAIAQGLLVNVGTVTRLDREAMLNAAQSACKAGTPWVLDPVAAGVLDYRTELVRELLCYKPDIIRGNASEIIAVSGALGLAKGVDSMVDSKEAIPYAQDLAGKTGSVVAVSGEVDYVTDGLRVVDIPGGHINMTKVTGMGCSLGALMAAFLAVVETPYQAAVDASMVFAYIGLRVGGLARGPGSFAVGFLDELSRV